MFYSKRKKLLASFQSFIICLILVTQVQASSGYTYSSQIEVGETLSWEIDEYRDFLTGESPGFYITDGFYTAQESTISIEVVEHPSDVLYNTPLLLWNSTTSWYDLYINDTIVHIAISMNSLMTLGFLQLPYLSPVSYQGNNAFQVIYDQMPQYNHTSTGTLNETGEFPIDYIYSELYSCNINNFGFHADSTLIYKRTQVINENLTYRWIWKEECEVSFDMDTGILIEQDYTIMNASQTIESDEFSTSIMTSYGWLFSSLESNYTFYSETPTTESTSNLLEVGVFSMFLLVFWIGIYQKRGKNLKIK